MCLFSNARNNDTTKRIKNLNGSSVHTISVIKTGENVRTKCLSYYIIHIFKINFFFKCPSSKKMQKQYSN